jgi:predicted DCC family thiol-disulfide oxidoreductase YuxK
MQHKPLVLFDGICGLCNASVTWIIRRDKTKQFQFAPLQGKTGAEWKDRFPHLQHVDSLVLVYNHSVYTESAAVLRIAKMLGFPWNLALLFWIVPGFLRNAVYRIVARNRYKWFGKLEQCMLPDVELADRFLK